MSFATAGAYLRELRKRRKLTQVALGVAADVGRSTIQRLEKGDSTVSVGYMFQVFDSLRASPQHYYDLALHATLTREQLARHQALLNGIQTYLRVLCEQKRVEAEALADVTGLSLTAVTTWLDDPAVHLSEFALLLILAYMDAPFADIAELLHASRNHTTLVRRLAEERGGYAIREHVPRAAQYRVVALESISRRLAVIVHNSEELSPASRSELVRIVDDLNHYHMRMSISLEGMMSGI